jgi:hypothetical protein
MENRFNSLEDIPLLRDAMAVGNEGAGGFQSRYHPGLNLISKLLRKGHWTPIVGAQWGYLPIGILGDCLG